MYNHGVNSTKHKRLQILDKAFKDFNFTDEPIEKYYTLGDTLGKIEFIFRLKLAIWLNTSITKIMNSLVLERAHFLMIF